MDFSISLVIFSLCLLLVFRYSTNLDRQETGRLQEISMDAKALSDILYTPGYPANWTNKTVVRIGIMDRPGQINATKLHDFALMCKKDYPDAKQRFSMTADFGIYFLDREGNASGYVGHPGASLTGNDIDLGSLEHEHLVRLERIVTLNSTGTKMVIYAWQ